MAPHWIPMAPHLVGMRDFTDLPIDRDNPTNHPQSTESCHKQRGQHRYSILRKRHTELLGQGSDIGSSQDAQVDLGWSVNEEKVEIWMTQVLANDDDQITEVIATGQTHGKEVKCITLVANVVADVLLASGLADMGYKIALEPRSSSLLPTWTCQHGCEYEDLVSDMLGGKSAIISQGIARRNDLRSLFEGMHVGKVLLLPDYGRVWLFTDSCQKTMKDASQNFERYDMFNEKNGSVVLDKFRVREHCGERPDVPGVIFWPQTVERSPSQPPRVLDDVIVPEKLDPNELRPESNFIDIMTRQKIIRSKVPNNMPTVVMNVQTGQREFGVGLARYVMISHCWSQETYEKWQIPLRQACASVGITHLWVDTLCIPQTANLETEDWNKEKEIPRMGQYYCEASATLALVPDCRNLVQGTLEVDEIYNWRVVKETYEQSRIEVKESLWSTRGWTYQEARLSYNLCFTNSRAACNAETLNYAWHVAGLMTEDLFWVSPGRQIQANDHWQSSTSNQSYRTGTMERFNLSRPKNDHFDSREGSTFWDAWKAMVDRNTTIREDKLNALMGLVDGLQCLLGTGFSLEQMMEHLIRTRLIGVGILGCTGPTNVGKKTWMPEDFTQSKLARLNSDIVQTRVFDEETAVVTDDGGLEVKAMKVEFVSRAGGPWGSYGNIKTKEGLVLRLEQSPSFTVEQVLLVVPAEKPNSNKTHYVRRCYILSGFDQPGRKWHKVDCRYAEVDPRTYGQTAWDSIDIWQIV